MHVRALLALAGAALAAAALAAAPAGAAQRLTVRPGDTITVKGSPVACAATGAPGKAGILCSVLGADGKEADGSYGAALSQAGEAIVVEFGPGGAAAKARKLWRVPAAHGAAAGAVRTAALGDSFALDATDLRCEVRLAGVGMPGVVCSRYAGSTVRADSNSIAIDREAAGIYRYDGKRRAVRKVEKRQPARAEQARRPQSRHARAASGPAPLELAVGETLKIPSSRITCLVTQDGGTPALFCLLSIVTTPVPNSYAVGLAKDGTAIMVAYDAKSRGALLRRFTQARRAPAADPVRGRTRVARFGNVYRVAGTDIVCLVAGAPGVLCTMNGPKGRIVGSAGIALVDGGSARIFQITGKTTLKVLAEQAEPRAKG